MYARSIDINLGYFVSSFYLYVINGIPIHDKT